MVEARRFLADAVAADGSNALARLRLGRVLDRLGEREPARKELEEALRLSQQPEIRFLAQLFAGHLHEEEGRVPEAAEAYRLARVIDPGSQSAAVALAHVLQLAGEAEQARGALEPAVDPGRRTSRDAYWDYLMGNALHGEELVDALRRESLE
jgi:tetratricopeptide (TPR) repeat protein